MFASEYEKLVKELNMQIEEGTFYTMNDTSKSAVTKNDVDTFDSIDYGKAPSYAGLAKITGFEMDTPVQNNLMKNSINSYFDSIKIDSSNLYRPMVTTMNNPLEKNVYKYKPTFDLAVNGMAFLSKNGGIVENPLSRSVNIVDRTMNYGVKENISAYEEEFGTELIGHYIEPVALNTYNMLDILEETKSAQELKFNAIPQQYALTTQKSTWRSIFFKQIDIFKGIKNIFSKQKIK